MSKEFKQGDEVEWDSHGASEDEPQYLVESDKSGGTAVDKPSALRRRS